MDCFAALAMIIDKNVVFASPALRGVAIHGEHGRAVGFIIQFLAETNQSH